MLFRLQAVEAELERQQKELAAPPPSARGLKIPEKPVESLTQQAKFAQTMFLQENTSFSVLQLADCEAELQSGTPSPSLQR